MRVATVRSPSLCCVVLGGFAWRVVRSVGSNAAVAGPGIVRLVVLCRGGSSFSDGSTATSAVSVSKVASWAGVCGWLVRTASWDCVITAAKVGDLNGAGRSGFVRASGACGGVGGADRDADTDDGRVTTEIRYARGGGAPSDHGLF